MSTTLSPTMSESELKKLFSRHDIVVKSVHIINDYYTRQFSWFGYIRMQCNKEESKSVDILHRKTVNKRLVVVKEALTRDERDGSPW